MATHSIILAWRIPWTQEAGGLLSMESQRVRHDWATNTHNAKNEENKISLHHHHHFAFTWSLLSYMSILPGYSGPSHFLPLSWINK